MGSRNNKLLGLLHETKGSTMLFFILFFLPLFVLLLVVLFRTGNIGSLADDTYQEAVNEATRAAAMRVDPLSNAKGNRRIAYNYAKDSFTGLLASALPIGGESPIRSIKYWLVVYNGDNPYGDYETYKVLPYYYCTNQSGALYEDTSAAPMGALTVKVTEQGIRSAADPTKGKKVTLKRPGVLAVIAVEMENLDKDTTDTVYRWSYHVIDE